MSLRQLERDSIRKFVEEAGNSHFRGARVLDYGCGAQPYKSLVQSFGAEYVGYDNENNPGWIVDGLNVDLPNGTYDVILMTQVLHNVVPIWNVQELLVELRKRFLVPGGHLVATYTTTWLESDPTICWLFTKSGMERLLEDAGYTIVRHDRRGSLDLDDLSAEETLTLGYGVIAKGVS